MRQITDAYSDVPVTIHDVGHHRRRHYHGRQDGSRSRSRRFSSARPAPIFAYAAFATYNGCSALSFAGGATTNSYDSTHPLVGWRTPRLDNFFGNVGTNGNLDANRQLRPKFNGTLSTPRTGVGNCTAGNVTAATAAGDGAVQDGLNQLSQPVSLPDACRNQSAAADDGIGTSSRTTAARAVPPTARRAPTARRLRRLRRHRCHDGGRRHQRGRRLAPERGDLRRQQLHDERQLDDRSWMTGQ